MGLGLTGNLKITITSHYILPSISVCAEWDFKHLDQAVEVCLISWHWWSSLWTRAYAAPVWLSLYLHHLGQWWRCIKCRTPVQWMHGMVSFFKMSPNDRTFSDLLSSSPPFLSSLPFFFPLSPLFFFLFFSPAFQVVNHFLCITLWFFISLGIQINMVSALRVRRKNK